MKFFRYIMPHITIALSLGSLVLIILDGYNPTLSFMTSFPSKIYFCTNSAAAIICAVMYATQENYRKKQ